MEINLTHAHPGLVPPQVLILISYFHILTPESMYGQGESATGLVDKTWSSLQSLFISAEIVRYDVLHRVLLYAGLG